MKHYLIDRGQGEAQTVTEEHIILACDRGEIGRNARIASCVSLGASGSFEPICSVPEFRKLIETREADLERRRQLKAEKTKALVANPIAKLVAKHIGRLVHVNYTNPDSLDGAWFADLNDCYITLQIGQSALLYVPLPQILHLVEDGASVTFRIAHPRR
jgi:hypothetical protein